MCGTKTPGALASELAKSAVKIRQVIESRAQADLYHRVVRFNEQAAGMAHPEIGKVVDEGLSDRLSEETAESLRSHAGNIGCLGL